jgi:hypothetical protein
MGDSNQGAQPPPAPGWRSGPPSLPLREVHQWPPTGSTTAPASAALRGGTMGLESQPLNATSMSTIKIAP